MKEITKDYLLNHKFDKTGIEPEEKEHRMSSGRFAVTMLSTLPMPDRDKLVELNILVSDLIHQRCETSASLEYKTNIKPNTLRRILNLRDKRNFTREMLAKFVVGMQLTVEEANELFSLQGFPLMADKVLLDAVVIHCLTNHYDIDEFFETCKQVGLDIVPA